MPYHRVLETFGHKTRKHPPSAMARMRLHPARRPAAPTCDTRLSWHRQQPPSAKSKAAISVAQRSSSDLKLNLHWHLLPAEGVWQDRDGHVKFYLGEPLGTMWTGATKAAQVT
jgi:hypothetical protein